MKASEIRQLTDKELSVKLAETKLELTRLKLSHAVTPSPNTVELKVMQRDIARFLTEKSARVAASINN